jgi:cytosine/adenosine deaminase-related metal-dependent hydrolase
MLLRARLVLPVSRPPIANGAVLVKDGRIEFAGPWPEAARLTNAPPHDLGEAILLPGLINAHCHLDYTAMANLIPPPRQFTDWIKSIVALKGTWSTAEYADSWKAGAAMLLRQGVTTVADIEAAPQLLPALWQATPLRVLSFRELIGFKNPAAASATVEAAASEWDALPAASQRVGLSPHAPYTTCAELLRAAATAARRRGWRLTTHLAESEAEYDMFTARAGPLHDWLKPQRDMADCGLGSPVQHLERCGYLGPDLLAVHCNYLWQGDPALLARHRVSVVHCPRSHAYFGHRRFPYETLVRAGVNVCLGTDSLASVTAPSGQPVELDLFAEMRAFAARAGDGPPDTILNLATVNGARALGRAGELGELSQGALADLIAVPFAGRVAGACEAVVHHSGPVAASMIGGQWAIPPHA